MSNWMSLVLGAFVLASPVAQAVDVVLSGGTALTSWEKLRGASQHDKWWGNFIQAAAVHIHHLKAANPKARIVWIVYRPSYITRGKEDGRNYLSVIKAAAREYGVQLVWADTTQQVADAINHSPRGKDKITSFTYFGHSNRFAFMLDYSNDVMAASRHWIHEDDIGKLLKREAFSPDADCRSYGCYTGLSMSAKWKKSMGIPLMGNTDTTRYYLVDKGEMPEGAGEWVR